MSAPASAGSFSFTFAVFIASYAFCLPSVYNVKAAPSSIGSERSSDNGSPVPLRAAIYQRSA